MDQLDLASRQSLYESIVKLLYTHRNSQRAVVTQLVLSLADLSVMLVDWADPIAVLLDTYASEPDMICCILEFLTVLPEELHDHRVLNTDVCLLFLILVGNSSNRTEIVEWKCAKSTPPSRQCG